MKRQKLIGLIVGLTSVLMLAYMNCGQVQFAELDGQGLDPSLAQLPLSNESGTETTPEQSDQDLIDNLPQEEQEILRPISDIDIYPELEDIFKCPDSDGILICHFPSNSESAHTLCVGGGAPLSHRRHEISFDASGEVLTLSDYLGPCRHETSN